MPQQDCKYKKEMKSFDVECFMTPCSAQTKHGKEFNLVPSLPFPSLEEQ